MKKSSSDHTVALVPAESWAFGSPEVAISGRSVDVGLIAEALIYYDRLLVNVSNQPQFAAVLEWFIRQDRFDELIALFADETIRVYEYSFATAPIYVTEKDVYDLMNIQDELQAKPNTFEQRYLYHKDIEAVVTKSRHRQALYRALRDRVIEVKAESFGESVNAARLDFGDGRRNALIVQAFVNELFRIKNLGRPPEVRAEVIHNQNGTHTTKVNVDFQKLWEIAGPSINWHKGLPLAAGAICNRLLLSASQLSCDLFLPRPMGALVGDKLFESARSVHKTTTTLENLKESVEFPDVRRLVNDGRLGLSDVLLLRKEARRFRGWLQSEAERDRDALIAYHHEVAKAARMTTLGRKSLDMFGYIGGGAVGGALGAAMAGTPGAAIGGAIGGSISYLSSIGTKLGADWKPVVFGEWLRDKISQLDQGRN